MRRAPFLGLTAIAAAALIAPAAAQPLTRIRMLGNPNDDSAALYYAMRSGAFARAGLDVTISPAASGAAVAAAVAGGSADIGKSSVLSIFEAHEKGIPFSVLSVAAIQEPATPFVATLVLKDAPVKTGKDLENQVVGVSSLSSIGRVAVCNWVEKTGGDWRKVQFVEIPLTQAAAALAQKRIVAAETAQPMLARALEENAYATLPTYAALAPRFAVTVWFTTRDWSAKNPEAARAFARVLAQSAAYTNAHHAETAPIMAQVSGVDVAVIQKMARVTNGSGVAPADLQPVIDASARYGLLKAAFPATELIDANAAR